MMENTIIMADDFDYTSLLGNLFSGYNSYNTAKNVSSLSNQLKNSYSNPSSLYSNYKANDSTFYNQLKAQNAASGRSTDAYKNGVAREAAYNNWLNQYRSGLAQQMSAYGSTASKYGTANPVFSVLGSLFNNQKGEDGKTVQSPMAKYANQGISSALGWLGNELGWSGSGSNNYNASSDPMASQYAQYGNDVSSALSNAINGGGDYDFNTSDNTSNYSDTYNAASDPIASNVGNDTGASQYNTGGVDYLSNLLGG